MDMIVATSSGARHVLDIMRVKPGCVITDINMPMIFSKKQCAKRPDVLVIRGGEILLPGEHVEMGDIGLPPRVVYAGLAETIILALEGRFEVFTVGTAPNGTRSARDLPAGSETWHATGSHLRRQRDLFG
jgi:predicted amino acid dehydrogenase